MNNAQLLVLNANIITMNDRQPKGEALAVKDGKIVLVGSNSDALEFSDRETLVLEAEGKTVLPGFIDCHVHLTYTATSTIEIDLFALGSLNQMLGVIGSVAQKCSAGEWVRARGFDDTMVVERRYPTRWELDKAAPRNPVILKRQDGHSCVLNSLGFEALDLPSQIDGLERDPQTKQPTGVLRRQANEMACTKVNATISDNAILKGLLEATYGAARKGITTIHALDGRTRDPKDISLVVSHMDEFPVDIVLYYQTTDVEEIVRLRLPRVGGCLLVDGSMDSHTAALYEPYADNPSTSGVLYFTDEQLSRFVLEAHRNDLQVAMHAIGDRAVDQLLNAYENALELCPRRNHRHRIEHIAVPSPDQVKRCSDMKIAVSVQPAFYYFWDMKKFYETRLGPERAQRIHPYSLFISEGIITGGGSDSPVTPIDPMLGIHAAVNHPISYHSVDVGQAIRMFTADAARLAFQEGVKGTLETGKYADLVILSENPFAVKRERIKEIKVEATIRRGHFTYNSLQVKSGP